MPNAARQLTRHLYEQVLAGRRAILEDLLADDFALAGTRERMTRDEWIDYMVRDTEWASIDVEHLDDSRPLDNAMVVTSRVTYDGTRADGHVGGSWAVVDVWQGRGVDWRLISRTTFPTARL
jgi:Domain of unknown function (DUF4440)